ncbi:MAG: hypothetical protein QF368_10010 [SAR202 cluster bacterium]|nr:hypothetical protein [SAR202 cluster bacterium]
MWVTLERDPKTDEWARVATTHRQGLIKRAQSAVISETVGPMLMVVVLIAAGILSAVWSHSGNSEIEVASITAEISDIQSANRQAPEIAVIPEPTTIPTTASTNSGAQALKAPAANAHLWLTNSPPVSDYRSVSAGNWLSQ